MAVYTVSEVLLKTDKLFQKINLTTEEIIEKEFSLHLNILANIEKELDSGNAGNNQKILQQLNKSHSSLRSIQFNKYLSRKIISTTQKPADEINDYYQVYYDYGFTHTGSYYGNTVLRKWGDFIFAIKSSPNRVIRLTQAILKRKQSPKKLRVHRILYDELIKGHIFNMYVDHLSALINSFRLEIMNIAEQLYDYELAKSNKTTSNITANPLPSIEPEKTLEKYKKKLVSFYSENSQRMEVYFQKSCTPELPAYWIRLISKRQQKQYYKQLVKLLETHAKNFYAFYEDWRFFECNQLYLLEVENLVLTTKEKYKAKVNHSIIPLIRQKEEFLLQLKDNVPELENNSDAYLTYYNKAIYSLQKENSDKNLIEEINKISSEIGKLIKHIELNLSHKLDLLPKRSAVVRHSNYKETIKRADIHFFNPREIVLLDIAPVFKEKTSQLASQIQQDLSELKNEFSDFDQITDFTLDTARNIIIKDPDKLPVSTDAFTQGIDRALNILQKEIQLSDKLLGNRLEKLDQHTKELVDNIWKLNDNDNILSIKANLIKSKALEESRQKGNIIKREYNRIRSVIRDKIDQYSASIFNRIHQLKIKLNLAKEEATVSSEVSNYLLEIDRRIERLPIVYRHLFENAPIKEHNLFLARDKEITKLNVAFDDWIKGNFAATLVMGEHGSGKTSLINHYSKRLKSSYKLIHYAIDDFIASREDFHRFILELFHEDELDKDNFKKPDYLVKTLNQKAEKRIIILDGLERFFLRKTGGFEALKTLVSLIASTNRSIFWICSISTQAGAYLQKTHQIKDYFDYIIELNQLKAEDIQSIILKRNRLSGYQLEFQIEGSDQRQDSSFKYANEYFESLYKVCENNIALALKFWLESVKSFSENTVKVGAFTNPDFNFLMTLSNDKIYSLLLIVLHRKISLKQHASLMNCSKEQSFRTLTVLKEDGIIKKESQYYELHTILYRHVVQLLKNKNYIH